MQSLAIQIFTVHSVHCIAGIVVVVVFLGNCQSSGKVTYNEGILALDGDVSNLAVLAESLLEILGASASAQASHVDLGILR